MPARRRRRDRHRRVTGIEHAQPGDLTFIANPKYQASISPRTLASAVIRRDERTSEGTRAALLRSAEPYLAFAQAVGLLTHGAPPPRGVDRLSAIAPTAQSWRRRVDWRVCRRRRRRVDRRAHDRLSERRHRPRRRHRRRLRHPRARLDSRARAGSAIASSCRTARSSAATGSASSSSRTART